MQTGNQVKQARIPTGVLGLDVALGGGILEGGLYLIEGMPGAGKTILSSQISFEWIKKGKRVLFVTLIAESHGKLVNHLKQLKFFDESEISRSLFYLSLFPSLLSGGLKELNKQIVAAIREYKPSLLVIDGFRTAREFSETEMGLSQFIHDLNSFVTSARCTTLVLAPLVGGDPHPEHTLVDGLIQLSQCAVGARTFREIEVCKLRGAKNLSGKHPFKISGEGIRIYPRLEAVLSTSPPVAPEKFDRLQFGVKELDAMIGGGILRGTTTSLLGAPGVGKTVLGLKFLEQGLKKGEKCLYFGFYESPDRLVRTAASMGIDFSPWIQRGQLSIIWQPALEYSFDELAYHLLDTIDEQKIQLLFIDGIEGFRDAAARPERLGRFLTALTTSLRARGVTTLFTEEIGLLIQDVRNPVMTLSAIIENVVLIRYVEVHAELRRVISIMKMRNSSYDPRLREFLVKDSKIVIGKSFEEVEGVLSGLGRESKGWKAPSGKKRNRLSSKRRS